MNCNTLRFKALLGIAIGLLGSAAVQAQCTTGLFYGDLKANFATHFPGVPVTILSGTNPSPSSSTNPACAGWQEMVLKIDIPVSCTAAIVLVEYEGLPIDWTLNIGDSPTNDGFAGDAGSTVHNAEAWILGENFAVANASGNPAAIDNPLVLEHFALTDSAVKFVIKDQFLSWGAPYGYVQSPNNKLLFAIPDTTVAAADQRSIYVGLNRVIGTNARNGCGARRVLVKFQ
jgi:hypothetical protein